MLPPTRHFWRLRFAARLLSPLLIACAGMVSAAITTFDYTQIDSITGSGTIAAPAQSTVGGVTIT